MQGRNDESDTEKDKIDFSPHYIPLMALENFSFDNRRQICNLFAWFDSNNSIFINMK